LMSSSLKSSKVNQEEERKVSRMVDRSLCSQYHL
jgi:hypothetical protein